MSVVIPAYNEEKNIERTVAEIQNFLIKKKGLTFEIIVVNDGSSDRTAEIVAEIAEKQPCVKLVSYEKNMGKGEAVRQGVMASTGELILFSDADLSTPVSEIEKFLPLVQQGYDIVIGSRRTRDSLITKKQPFHRRVSGRVFQALVRIILGMPFSDTQCGFKLFKREIAKKLFASLNHKGFSFDVEVIYKAYLAEYRIKEVGVIWANDPSTTVRFFRDSSKCFLDLIKIRAGK